MPKTNYRNLPLAMLTVAVLLGPRLQGAMTIGSTNYTLTPGQSCVLTVSAPAPSA